MSWSPNGTKVVTGSRDRTIQIYNAATGNCDATLTGHTGWVTNVAWETDDRVISSSDDGTTRVWELPAGKCVLVRKNSVGDLTFESKNQFIAGLTKEGEPVGVKCDKVHVNGDRAVGWVGQSVYFFELAGEARRIDPVISLAQP
jgi:WD40 repeat protein